MTRPSLAAQLLRRRTIGMLVAEAGTSSEGPGTLGRHLSMIQLAMISVGATLGTGILALLAEQIPHAGPGIWMSVLLAAIPALLSALSYAEMAGAVPVSGSSYSYAYVTLGEGVAWVVGWCLVLEYGVSVAAVAAGAGQYVDETLAIFDLSLPTAIASDPSAEGGVFNLSAFLLVILAMVLLLRGVREAAWINTVLVLLKIVVLLFFAAVAFTAFRIDHFSGMFDTFFPGVTGAAAVLFFSYIGFDAASTAGEEARNPTRDLPRAILLGMGLVTVIYVVVAVAAIGAREASWFRENGLVTVLAEVTGQPWFGVVFSLGALIAFASIVLTVLYGQTRILLTMSRDGLVPRVLGRISPRTQTPVVGTLIVGIVIAVAAGVVPLGELANATSIGTFAAFTVVNIAVIVLRYRRPELPRTYRVPLFPVIPVLGALTCLALMSQLSASTWIAFACWMVVGAVIYLGYGRRHSRVGALAEAKYRAALVEA
ncbi:amino acid permease [Microbacterium oryzae]|uniref:Amino acid permease n=1 Tax=Microbacterium oryzae TaxID=743009 RepID=A0A6I6E8F1_9MICO|nr:amino acid permease [Microbacterium oryzae]QGU27468.1 amino acid permease [Microbacterium oryzae]